MKVNESFSFERHRILDPTIYPIRLKSLEQRASDSEP
jgi:hypothetical protein